jgi:hypothetical protein
VRVAAGLAVAVALLHCPWLPVRALADPAAWLARPAAQAGRAVLREIPDGATVAADNRLAPQLTARCTVYLFPTEPSQRVRPEWVALTGGTPPSLPGYQLVVDRDGVILLRAGDQR